MPTVNRSLLASLACCLVATADATPACAVPEDDQAWIERGVAAWHMARRDLAGIGELDNFQAIFFSADCVLKSRNALTGDALAVTWDAAPHDGMITLPDGDAMPAVVTSFTGTDESHAFFVMSTPSVWRAGGVDGGALGLDTLMVAVMLHEGSHVAQAATYGLRVTELEQRYALPASFGDDSLQERFGTNEAFGASMARETELFLAAASAADDAEARRLAAEARALMRVRAERWYSGEDAYWRAAEDIWLTFEGSGQWVGYRWLTDARGAAMPASIAMAEFGQRSGWWSQNQGLAIALVLERLAGADWQRHAFGDGAKTLLEMLDEALGP